jgi:uncharacterized protein YjbI with pentapeptide repeats
LFGGGESLLLEEEVRTLLAQRSRGVVALMGWGGSGKTTALRHLAAVLGEDDRLCFLDEPWFDQILNRPPNRLLVCTIHARKLEMIDLANGHLIGCDYASTGTPTKIPMRAIYHTHGWDRDDLIEYLLAVHPNQCAAVMSRLSTEDHLLFRDVPDLWRVVLDRLAVDPAVADGRSAFRSHLKELLCDTDLIKRARSACLNAVCEAGASPADREALGSTGFAGDVKRMLRHSAVQEMLAIDRIVADLRRDAECDFLARTLPSHLVTAAGKLLRDDVEALEHLRTLLTGPSWSHAMSASVLHAAGIGWMPSGEKPPVLARAHLARADWPRVKLAGADVMKACLSMADLSAADLRQAAAFGTDFSQTVFTDADLSGIQAVEASLGGAELRGVKAERANFNAASLVEARIVQANLHAASFRDANLNRVVFEESNLSGADFAGSHIERAVFCEVDLSEAVLSGLCLRESSWHDVRRFGGAQLGKCDLEGLSLPRADFSGANLQGALLTATVMPGASFQNANLRDTGLADIEWEGADLRGADLTGATFHMGSTRSGLVGSTIACEGSRTGFYTDDYEEQRFKAPEEIRKANLCGADLRGACIEGVDFYLVDLRGARLDPGQEEHVRRCKAILVTPVC